MLCPANDSSSARVNRAISRRPDATSGRRRCRRRSRGTRRRCGSRAARSARRWPGSSTPGRREAPGGRTPRGSRGPAAARSRVRDGPDGVASRLRYMCGSSCGWVSSNRSQSANIASACSGGNVADTSAVSDSTCASDISSPSGRDPQGDGSPVVGAVASRRAGCRPRRSAARTGGGGRSSRRPASAAGPQVGSAANASAIVAVIASTSAGVAVRIESRSSASSRRRSPRDARLRCDLRVRERLPRRGAGGAARDELGDVDADEVLDDLRGWSRAGRRRSGRSGRCRCRRSRSRSCSRSPTSGSEAARTISGSWAMICWRSSSAAFSASASACARDDSASALPSHADRLGLGLTLRAQRLGGRDAAVLLGDTLRLDGLGGRAAGVAVGVGGRDGGRRAAARLLLDRVRLGIRDRADLGVQLLLAQARRACRR